MTRERKNTTFRFAKAPAQPTPFTSAPTSTSLSARTTSHDHFSSLPAELRNEICALVLLSDDCVVPILGAFPPLTRTCKLLRAESMPIYLGTREFGCTIASRDRTSLLDWLEILSGLDANVKRAFTRLHLAFDGGILEMRPVCGCHHDAGRGFCWSPNMDLWDALVVRLAKAGLVPAQICIGHKLEEQIRTALDLNDGEGVQYSAQGYYGGYGRMIRAESKGESYLFTRFVLPPLLNFHRLHDPETHLDSLEYILQEQRMHNEADMQEVMEMIRFALRTCETSPRLWFVRWIRKSAEAAVSIEGLAGKGRRCLAMRAGVRPGAHARVMALLSREQRALDSAGDGTVVAACAECAARDLEPWEDAS